MTLPEDLGTLPENEKFPLDEDALTGKDEKRTVDYFRRLMKRHTDVYRNIAKVVNYLKRNPGGVGSGVPGNTVVSEISNGQAPYSGASTSFSREDHTHGTPPTPVITYTGSAERTVGGITDGDSFTTATMTAMWDKLIKQEKFPILAAPSSTFVSDYTGYREIGEIITTITFNAAFDQGSINPQYTAASPYRSGPPNKYIYTGGTLTDSISTSLTDVQTESGYTVISGAQSWTCQVAYDAGVQPKSSYDNNYDVPLPAGSTAVDTQTITGVYPYYGTTSVITTLTKQPLASMSSSYVQIDMIAESGTDKQKAEFPQVWSAITGIQFYNTVSSAWEWIGGTQANSLTYFDKTASTETIQGNVINYWLYTHNGPLTGARQTRWYTT